MIDSSKLLTVKHYANTQGVSTTAVYTWMTQGRVKSVKIDGVTFVEIDKEELKTIKQEKK